MSESDRETRLFHPTWRTIGLCWLAIGLAWAPAVYLMDQSQRGWHAFAEAVVLSVASFIPWFAATPAIFRACERFDFARHPARDLGLVLVASIFALPIFALLSRIFGLGAARLLGFAEPLGTIAQWLTATVITSLFSVPTWFAVVAIGLVLAAGKRSAERERLLANARLDALRSELNPHFLFNSLGGIAELAHQSPDDAERAIGNLADIMRASLAERRRLRPFGDEIASVRDHVELYTALIKGVNLQLEVEPAAWRADVPSHILTPLIENATTHGSAPASEPFVIAIRARREQAMLVVELANPCSEIARPSRGLGSGTANVRQRLAALYGNRAQLAAVRDGGSYVVTLRIPFEHTEADG